MLNNDFRYWKPLDNRYRPSFYLIDKTDAVRYRFIGEVHGDTR